MKRRQVLLAIAGISAALIASRHAGAQSKVPVIGLLDAGERVTWWTAFKQQMTQLGYVEGKTVAYETRYAKGRLGQLSPLAEDLVKRKVTLIVTAATVATQAAQRATETIPIVTASGADHVSMGFAASLARPGGNITGVSSISSELTEKRFELLRETFPRMTRLAVLWQSDNTGSTTAMRDLERVAQASKIKLQNVGVRKAEDMPGAFSSAVKERADVMFVVGGPLTADERKQIGALALAHKMPTIHNAAEDVEAGGLMSFGTNYPELFRRAAFYVDKVLKGAKPGDLPIEHPTKLELVINMKTAKAIGVQIPKAMLLRADRVID